MGCGPAVVVDAQLGNAPLDAVPGWFAYIERRLSRFRDDSELCRLNRSGGAPVPVSPLSWQAMRLALAAARWSDGLVHPAMLPMLERCGYDRDFGAIDGTIVAAAAPTTAYAAPDWRCIALDARHRTITLPPGMRVGLWSVLCSVQHPRRSPTLRLHTSAS